MTGTALAVRGLVKRYGGRPVVDGLSFEVQPGEIFALLGPNGAGKTTTIEICEGFRNADEGTVSVLDRHPRERSLRELVGAMPQEAAMQSQIRPREAMRLFASFYETPADPDILLDRLGLAPHAAQPYRSLSGGAKQRLSLGLALVGRPRLVFLDEPTVGMDVSARAQTWKLIGELRAEGTTVLLTTHLLDEAERVADRVAIVHHGRMVAIGRPHELIAGPAPDRIRFRTDRPVNPGGLADMLGVAVEGSAADGYSLEASPTPELLSALASTLAAQQVLLTELVTGNRSLEEVFVELTDSGVGNP